MLQQVIWIQNDLFARHYITPFDAEPDTKISVTRSTASLVAGGLLALGAGLVHFIL